MQKWCANYPQMWGTKDHSLEFARPTILSMFLSSLNLSRTVPLTASSFSFSAPLTWTPQHSITSGFILFILERQGLLKVVQANVCPSSKFAERKRPKWFARPPKPTPLGMLSELKFMAHCQKKESENWNYCHLYLGDRRLNSGFSANTLFCSIMQSNLHYHALQNALLKLRFNPKFIWKHKTSNLQVLDKRIEWGEFPCFQKHFSLNLNLRLFILWLGLVWDTGFCCCYHNSQWSFSYLVTL